MNISFRQMRAFAAIARAGSFTGAARQLHLTQSAVSMLVQQLEEELGLQLFDRGRTVITLTEAGEQLLPLAQRILDDVRQVMDGASDMRALRRGFLRVVAPQMMACTWVAEVLAEFGTKYPEIGVTVTDSIADDVVAKIRRGDAELGIGPERPTGDDVACSFLMNIPMRLVCPATHPAAKRTKVPWKDLRNERWVSYSKDFTRDLERILHAHGESLSMNAISEVSYLTTTLALVGNRVGLAVAPDYARAFAGNFNVKFVPLHAPAIIREYFIYQRKGRALSPSSIAFVQMLRRHAESTT